MSNRRKPPNYIEKGATTVAINSYNLSSMQTFHAWCNFIVRLPAIICNQTFRNRKEPSYFGKNTRVRLRRRLTLMQAGEKFPPLVCASNQLFLLFSHNFLLPPSN